MSLDFVWDVATSIVLGYVVVAIIFVTLKGDW